VPAARRVAVLANALDPFSKLSVKQIRLAGEAAHCLCRPIGQRQHHFGSRPKGRGGFDPQQPSPTSAIAMQQSRAMGSVN